MQVTCTSAMSVAAGLTAASRETEAPSAGCSASWTSSVSAVGDGVNFGLGEGALVSGESDPLPSRPQPFTPAHMNTDERGTSPGVWQTGRCKITASGHRKFPSWTKENIEDVGTPRQSDHVMKESGESSNGGPSRSGGSLEIRDGAQRVSSRITTSPGDYWLVTESVSSTGGSPKSRTTSPADCWSVTECVSSMGESPKSGATSPVDSWSVSKSVSSMGESTKSGTSSPGDSWSDAESASSTEGSTENGTRSAPEIGEAVCIDVPSDLVPSEGSEDGTIVWK